MTGCMAPGGSIAAALEYCKSFKAYRPGTEEEKNTVIDQTRRRYEVAPSNRLALRKRASLRLQKTALCHSALFEALLPYEVLKAASNILHEASLVHRFRSIKRNVCFAPTSMIFHKHSISIGTAIKSEFGKIFHGL
ncbi:hypothetical protein NHQ30_005133 [Ciborinia camelliae]|nr:hypothetical protein NHQ30_005133 [Ciborinia camelliae]